MKMFCVMCKHGVYGKEKRMAGGGGEEAGKK
jgi:hypothetical protein